MGQKALIFGRFSPFGPAVQWLADRAGRADARVSGNVPATSGFSFAAPKVMVLAGQMFPPLFSLKITFSLNLHSLSDCTKTTISQWNQIISEFIFQFID